MTFWETIEGGEYVMFALGVIVIVCIVILWCRKAILNADRRKTEMMMPRVRDYVVEGDIENARQLSSEIPTHGAKVILTGLKNIGEPLPEVKKAIEETTIAERDKMNIGLRWMRVFAFSSPLLGVAGSLVGIIDRLNNLGEAGNETNISMVCGAIAPTIVTAVAGLGVGILAFVFLELLGSITHKAGRYLEATGHEFVELLKEPA